MPRTSKVKALEERINTLSAIVGRANLLARLGFSYSGERDIYNALGYPKNLTFDDYYAQYKRQDIAKAIIDRPVSATWRGKISVIETEERYTEFEKGWDKLDSQLNLRAKFARVDRLAGLGHYGVLLLGFDDVKSISDMANPVRKGKRQLKYVKPLSEVSAKIQEWDNNPNSERYGFPQIYQLMLELADTSTITINVHYSRIIHIPGQLLEGEIEGMPRLEAVFNRLLDLEKVVGGSAEMFWRGARPGFKGIVSEGYEMSKEDEAELQKQLDEYEHGLRRFLVNRGVNIDALAQQVSDPRNHVDVQLQMISAVTGIPRRILTGSERGELASTEDRNTWLSMIQERREEYAEPVILRPFIDKCIEFGVLAKPKTDYTVQWTDLWAASEKELADIGQIRATALKDYLMVPGAMDVIPPDVFYEKFLGLGRDQIDLIKELQLKGIDEDIRGSATEEEEELLDESSNVE